MSDLKHKAKYMHIRDVLKDYQRYYIRRSPNNDDLTPISYSESRRLGVVPGNIKIEVWEAIKKNIALGDLVGESINGKEIVAVEFSRFNVKLTYGDGSTDLLFRKPMYEVDYK